MISSLTMGQTILWNGKDFLRRSLAWSVSKPNQLRRAHFLFGEIALLRVFAFCPFLSLGLVALYVFAAVCILLSCM